MVVAREAISEHGMSYTDGKGMVRARPEVAICRDARTQFLRSLRELGLNDTEDPDSGYKHPLSPFAIVGR